MCVPPPGSTRWQRTLFRSLMVRLRNDGSVSHEWGRKVMTPALGMFLLFVLTTLVITFWAARKSRSAAAFFTASRRITGWQNGVAVAGDYMSAASFLGIAGLIAFYGYDGFMFSVGWLGAYLTVLLV